MNLKPLIILSFVCCQVNAQSPKKDTTLILKTDNYSNVKTQGKGNDYTGTINVDSGGTKSPIRQWKPGMIPGGYERLTKKADSLFKAKQFADAAERYILALRINNNTGIVKHGYNAACSFAMMNRPDYAFQQLYNIAESGNYRDYAEIQREEYFKSLHADGHWAPLIALIKRNAVKIKEELNSKTQQENK